MRLANNDDITMLVSLMAEFYAESDYQLEREPARLAFAKLIADNRLGSVWIINASQQDVGYAVITFRFGMEYGGLMACIDDLYVVPSFRNKGLGTDALKQIRDECARIGILAMTVEVGQGNMAAQKVYRRVGMLEPPGRQLLTLSFKGPMHAV